MNTEIVRRLTESFKNYGRAKLIADSLLNDEVLLEMFRKWARDRAARDDNLFFKSIFGQAAAHDDDRGSK